ncbi:type IX secretion system anionic LPS delivery protein PorZ [Draconibacterium halophilum]|uniref:T9SS type A sorting domain-containing protein n=1 Tax=Draconibacterium halophilum TaxID=2706887 RepID=A0A6C0RAD1_9BACT|nr:two-component regulator propeller domain-containing protein [Draconibacterium halophilum]QIA06393.1 T9SS type A sorting domain-containing protein [Draconibacterium halophilum]
MIKRFILSAIILLPFFVSQAQREQGSWHDYLSYNNASKIAVSPNKVYCLTEGGLFYYDLEDNSVNKFGDAIQLSDFGVKTIAYNDQNEVLVIAYENSNIDLLYDNGEVVNLSDIKRKTIVGNKVINNICFSGNEAYLACGFGIVVLNLERQEVKDTYYIGDGGSSLVVNDVETDNNSIFAATNQGIYRADKNEPNLANFANWIHVDDIPRADDVFNHLVNHAGNIIANYAAGEWYLDEMYILTNSTWEAYNSSIRYAFDIQSNGEYLTIASRSAVFIIDNNHSQIGRIDNYAFNNGTEEDVNPRSAGISADGSVWIADNNEVLVRYYNESFEQTLPPGPINNDMFFVGAFNSEIWMTPGSTTGFIRPLFQRYNNNGWTYFTEETHPELEGFHNILAIEVDPRDPNHFFAASWGGGLLEYRNDELVERYYNLNSPLETALPEQPNEPYTRVGGMSFDSEGNLWITNAECAHNLHKLSPTGDWESFELPEIANSRNVTTIIVNENEDKWMLVPGHDAYVVNRNGDQKRRLFVTTYFSNGTDEITTRMNDVFAIAEDQEGAIWIGSSKGVAVYSNPSRIWNSETFYATQPGLDLNDGIYHPLLETETVTAIAVDGANRKWLGTKNSGVFLVSETGEAEVEHFTTENSPLLSNNILSIAINEKNGEVFLGTDKGLISYQGEATGGADTYSDVYVYPNPVRETYDGPVTIAGLIENTDVKITDITGNLVYKTTSFGGQAVWDGNNLNGNRVKTGVYLVFCNDENGEETHITKILFIH